jgi:hypothetical protein
MITRYALTEVTVLPPGKSSRETPAPIYPGYRNSHILFESAEYPKCWADFHPLGDGPILPGETGEAQVLVQGPPEELAAHLFVGARFSFTEGGCLVGTGVIMALEDATASDE